MRSQPRAWQFLGVPIDSIALEGGTELAPSVMRDAGLVEALSLRDAGDTQLRLRTPVRDPDTGVVANAEVVAMSSELRDRLRSVLQSGGPTLVMGGCCTAVPAIVGAMQNVYGETGLVYIDGHLDLYDGKSSPTGEAADMPLAVLLGAGPTEWAAAATAGLPGIQSADIALVGPRDRDEAMANDSLLPEDFPEMQYVDANAVKQTDVGGLGASIASRMLEGRAGGYWVHIDLDVLDETEFPATDYLQAGGLDWPTLTRLVAPLVVNPLCRGLSLTCFNPEKDLDGKSTTALMEFIDQVVRCGSTSAPFGVEDRPHGT